MDFYGVILNNSDFTPKRIWTAGLLSISFFVCRYLHNPHTRHIEVVVLIVPISESGAQVVGVIGKMRHYLFLLDLPR